MSTDCSNPTPAAVASSSSSLFLAACRSISPQTEPARILAAGDPLPAVPANFPATKLIPNSRFVVDGFRFAGDFSVAYFLSHFHSDHYVGLGPVWRCGVVFCSETTAKLVTDVLAVPAQFVYPLALGKSINIDGWDVATVDANHCPGAVQFLFQAPGGEKYVHTGDFRFHDTMKSCAALCHYVGADAIFLDTTYCNPKYIFPTQEESVDYVSQSIQKIMDENSAESVLFLIATYVVGKERILLEVAQRCDRLIHVDSRKMSILSILGLDKTGVFTEEVTATNVHVIGWNLLGETWPYFRPNFAKMKEIMVERGYCRAVGYVATGWMYETKKKGFSVRSKDSLEIHLVPYSEHSNYEELREYVKFLKPKRVIPTVGADLERLDSKNMAALQKHFAGLVDETANKHDFLMAFHQKSLNTVVSIEEETNTGNLCRQEGGAVETKIEFSPHNLSPESGKVLDEKRLAEVKEEFLAMLPSWVTQDQILCLLVSSGWDVVRAFSEFCERERDYFEEAKRCSVVMPSLDKISPNSSEYFAKQNSSQEALANDLQNILKQPTKVMNLTPCKTILSSAKKRALISGSSNAKKKAKLNTNEQFCGKKQSRITHFFGKPVANSSICIKTGTIVAKEIMKNDSELSATNLELVDQFLQIINDGMSRDSAIIFLQEAKGDVSTAVDLFYERNCDSCGKAGENDTERADVDVVNCKNGSGAFESVSETLSSAAHTCIVDEAATVKVSLSLEKYLPVKHACWTYGEPAPYLHLARTFDMVEREKGKIKTVSMLCNMFRSLLALSPVDVLPAAYLCTNKIAADHENV